LPILRIKISIAARIFLSLYLTLVFSGVHVLPGACFRIFHFQNYPNNVLQQSDPRVHTTIGK